MASGLTDTPRASTTDDGATAPPEPQPQPAHVDFFSTAIGKTLRAIAYVWVSTGLVALGAYTANPSISLRALLIGALISGSNGTLVLLKGVLDPSTPTLPS